MRTGIFLFGRTGRAQWHTIVQWNEPLSNENWGQCVEERVDASTAADRQYVWHPYYIDALAISYNSSGTAHYYVQDGNFNLTAAMDSSGAVVERYSFTPYGECIVLNADFTLDSSSGGDGLSDISNEFTYTGRRLDVETGLYQYRHRYYHAQLGRFVNRDPIGYEGSKWNLQRYAGSNPLNRLDHYGLFDGIKPPMGGWPPGSKTPWPVPIDTIFEDLMPGPLADSGSSAGSCPVSNPCLKIKTHASDECGDIEGFCWDICKTWFFKKSCFKKCGVISECCEINSEADFLECQRNQGSVTEADYQVQVNALIQKAKNLSCDSLSVSGGGGTILPLGVPGIVPLPKPIPVPEGFDPGWPE